jgi:competence protein ComEA
VQVAVVVVAGLALAALLWQWRDRRSGPPIVIQDARADATVVVQVAGAVATPGVYDFPYGARLDDAFDRAGGPLPDADLAAFNLARRLQDGEQIVVPRLQPTPSPVPPGQPTPVPPTVIPTAPPADPIVAGDAPVAPTLVNLNTATVEELIALPEIGEVRAAAIVAYREANGPFASVDELVNVDGISERIVEIIRPYVTVGA